VSIIHSRNTGGITVPPEIIEWFRGRLRDITLEGDVLVKRNGELDAERDANQNRISQLNDEFRSLAVMLRKYGHDPDSMLASVRAENASAVIESRTSADPQDADLRAIRAALSDKPGPTGAAMDIVRAAPKQRILYSDLIERLTSAIKAGEVATNATDPEKLVSSIIGSLVSRRKLHRVEDVVSLVEE